MVVQPHVAQPIAAQGERPEKLSGNDFKRWHQKILFYLTSLNLTSSAKIAKALWESLENKYKIEDAGLKHKRKEMGLEDLIVRLRIEEDNRLSEMKSERLQIEAKANLMEQNEITSNKRKRVVYKRIDYKPKKGKAKMIGNCYNCGKSNHMGQSDFLRKIKRIFQRSGLYL
ncbi:UNVERIFIED_CONTAM: hypothetical protein Sradi_7015500 [Sesamum radiatum]|uniref:CCHC-type domain-containing protein n=1 Tax=Sesamum radiatum TaxID=300843 RepID=A0AAW2JBH0_SESRA